jgi:hypothetical protein
MQSLCSVFHTKRTYKDIISVPKLSCYTNLPAVVLGKTSFSRINRPFGSEVNLALSSYSPTRYGVEDKGIHSLWFLTSQKSEISFYYNHDWPTAEPRPLVGGG